MSGLIPIGSIQAAGDITTGANIRRGGTESQKAVDERVSVSVRPLVAEAIAADGTIAAAASAAVGAAIADKSLSYTLTHGLYSTPAALTVVRGTPTYVAPAKFGAGSLGGGAVNVGTPVPQPTTAPVTVEFWVRASAPPSLIQVAAGFGSGLYVAIEPTTGYASLTLSAAAASKVLSNVNVCDGNWHHIAVEVLQPAGTITDFKFWVDGVRFSGSPTISARAWVSTFTVGGFATPAGYEFSGRVDDVRVSKVSRYAANFTPPTVPHGLDANVIALASMDNNQYDRLTSRYQARPAGAPDGAVTYVGPVQPSDWRTNDRWVQI